MPTPTPELLEQLRHLPMADQMSWLDRWSRALLDGRAPKPFTSASAIIVRNTTAVLGSDSHASTPDSEQTRLN